MTFTKRFASGLTLVATKMPELHSVATGIMVNVGSTKESAANNGYSHLIEHMLFKGTPSRSATDISEQMDDIGAMINAFTAKECTCFYTKSIDSDLEKCLELLSDIFFNATFPTEELEREKHVVIEEILMSGDIPDDVSQDLICSAVFGENGLGQTILGSQENVANATRESLFEYKNKYYVAPETVVTVAGNFDENQLVTLVEKYVESNFTACENPSENSAVQHTYKQFLHKFSDVQQSHLEWAFPTVPLTHQDRFALDTLASVLGGGMSSRLFKSVREKHGLAYSVYATSNVMQNGGFFEIYCGTSPDHVTKVCQLVEAEINSIIAEGITESELLRAKAQTVNGLEMGCESNLAVMRLNGKEFLTKRVPFDMDKVVENYRAVTTDDVKRVAEKYLKNGYACSYVGKECADFDKVASIQIK